MKRPTELLHQVLFNEGFCVNLAVERDFQVIESRFEHEGMSFLTIALPVLCDALERGLSIGRITPQLFPGFNTHRRGGSLPALLQGFFMRVFTSEGWLLEHPCIDSIRAIRQITRLFKKVELPCSSARVKRAYERYVSNDQEIIEPSAWCPINTVLLHSVAGYLWSDLEDVSGELYCSPGIFGSGATAERSTLNERLSIREWPSRSEASFPSSYHTSNRECDTESFNRIRFHGPTEERPVRVVQVPKTLKTPRTISVEPSYMMLMQQSIAKPLMDYLESERFPYASIRFTDQTVNQDLARVGSLDGSFATIDLSDASDLVSNDLVKTLFRSCPTFLDYIQDCRSTRAQLPGGTLLTLRKFASMGSALCFPIESMAFFTIALTSMVRQSGKRLSRHLLAEMAAKLSVYGDDIIVPTETAAGVMADLESFGLRVNHGKSFSTGFFRESCGGDYYKGVNVTPTYVRKWDYSGNTRDASIISAYVSLSNQLYWKGLWHASQFVRTHLEGFLGQDHLPVTSRDEGYLSFTSCYFTSGRYRWNPHLSGYAVRAYSVVPSKREDPTLDLRAVMLGSFQQAHHLERRETLRNSSWTSRRRDSSILHQNECKFDSITCSDSPLLDHGFGPAVYSWIVELRKRLEHLAPIQQTDLVTSVVPYATRLQRRWYPTLTGGIGSW